MRHQLTSNKLAQPQVRGIALVVVLILMTVISMVAGATLRAALNAEQITLDLRLENLAREAAHIGLRHCEQSLLQTTPQLTIHPAPPSQQPALWTRWSTWHGPQMQAHNIPASASHNHADHLTQNAPPQCLIEVNPAHPQLMTVTARGFSPDYQADSAGRAVRGAAAWVQSTVLRCTAGDGVCQAVSPAAASAPGSGASSIAVITAAPTEPDLPSATPHLQSRVWRVLLNPPTP